MDFLITFINDIYTSIHFNQPNQHLQARPPITFQATAQIQNHTLASLMKIKIENLKFQCHLQVKARVNPAPTTVAVNGHGITLTIFQLFSHPYTLHPAHPTLAS
jgi:hypothetical protein